VRPGVARPLPDSRAELARRAAAALTAAAAPAPASLDLILSDDRELAELNREHMGHSGATDVLSFPMLPPDAFPPHAGQRASRHADAQPLAVGQRFPLPPRQRLHLGDVILSVEHAVAQARAGHGGQTGDVAWSAADELRLLVIHGVLHVCGWDHAQATEETAMRQMERYLLERA
jgi:probable rRNA maturation factor